MADLGAYPFIFIQMFNKMKLKLKHRKKLSLKELGKNKTLSVTTVLPMNQKT